MTVRVAKNKLTGRPARKQPDVVLGKRENGWPGVTVHVPHAYNYVCFDNPELLKHFIDDLKIAYKHLTQHDQTVS